MELKFDENLDARLAVLLGQARHEVTTAQGQGLRGIGDQELCEHCVAEELVLVTLDKDFSNVLRYPPEQTPGVVVLRGPNNLFGTMRVLVETLIQALAKEEPAGRLWIVEPGRFRVHESPEP